MNGQVELGPLFTVGLVLVAYGLVRRRPRALVLGAAAIAIDRTAAGRQVTGALKRHTSAPA